VKLLLDENLSDKIVARVSDLFPDCAHVKSVALMRANDAAVADWARHHGFAIVSKDTDFYHRSVALGSPPKFIWLRVRQLWNRGDYRSLTVPARAYS
jgi:predicted nuclease of predicted toxin-antitoxin system